MSDDAALGFYLVVLWIAVLGILAPDSGRSPIVRRAKQLAGVTFVVLVADSMRMAH